MSVISDDPFGDAPVSMPASEFNQIAETGVTADPTPSPEVSSADAGTVEVARGGPVSGGRRAPVPAPPPLPAWADTSAQDHEDGADGQLDYSDLAAINRDLLRLRVRMNRARRAMRQASREAVEAKLRYQRALRRALVQQSGGSAETRRAAAELMCEELEADMVMKAQVADEYTTLFRSVRDDIENAKVVAYNLRALANLL